MNPLLLLPTRGILILFTWFFVMPLAEATGDWSQYRGPQAAGVDDRVAAPATWNIATGENVRWQTPISGLAHSSPILWGDRIYITTAVNPKGAELKLELTASIDAARENTPHQWHLLALDKATGKILWDRVALETIPRVERHPKSTHCNSTPATDGRHIVAILGSEGLFCFSMDGQLIWRKDLGSMDTGFYENPSSQWGFASSPVIHDGKVVVLCDVHKDSFIASFDLSDGKELWRTPRKDVPTWGTPTVIATGGRTQIVVNGWHHSGGYDFSTGQELWKLDNGGNTPVPTPVTAHGLVYLSSAYGKFRPVRAIRLDASGDITSAETDAPNAAFAWSQPRQGSYMQTPIVVGQWLFVGSDLGVVTCFDAKSGVIRFSERLNRGGEGFSASPVSDGRNVFFVSELGKVFIVPAAETFSVRSTNELGGTCMAAPALSDGTIYFRTHEKLIAVGFKE